MAIQSGKDSKVAVPNHRYVQLLAVIAALSMMVFLLLLQFNVFRSHNNWTIGTGAKGGTYHAFGGSLIEALSSSTGIAPFEEFKELETHGSAENLKRLQSGEIDFAFAQSDSFFAEDTRLIAALYKEVLHVIVRADSQINSVSDIEPKRVFVGAAGSGTRELTMKMLRHFHIGPTQNLPKEIDAGPKNKDDNLMEWLGQRFVANEIDVAFVLTPPGSREFRDLVNNESVALRLVGFQSRDDSENPASGFSVVSQGVRPFKLPSFLYGSQPEDPIFTLHVEALLVTTQATDKSLVRDVTESLFSHRNKIANQIGQTLSLRESENPEASFLPFHKGSKSYYARENPSFVVEYAEVISLTITLLVGLWSIGALFVKWRAGLKKERIDVYYAQLGESSHLQDSDRLASLRRIHEHAFSDLMAERLAANESFIIFQDYLLSEITRTERSIDRQAE